MLKVLRYGEIVIWDLRRWSCVGGGLQSPNGCYRRPRLFEFRQLVGHAIFISIIYLTLSTQERKTAPEPLFLRFGGSRGFRVERGVGQDGG